MSKKKKQLRTEAKNHRSVPGPPLFLKKSVEIMKTAPETTAKITQAPLTKKKNADSNR